MRMKKLKEFAGGLHVPGGIIHPLVIASALTWFMKNMDIYFSAHDAFL
jgi:hypothetical protein